MKTIATAVALSLVLSATGAIAQKRGTAEEQQACTPDVYRLCNDFIPDEDRIVACLRKKQKQLSAACAKVFDAEEDTRKQKKG